MKYMLFAIAVTMASMGCSKHEVYERNLQYMTAQTFQAEKAMAAKHLQEAQNSLAQAQTSSDPERIKKAQAAFIEADGRYKGIEFEERRRSRP